MISRGLMTSNNDCYETPQRLFDKLNEEFRFTLDAAANEANAKCTNFFTVEDDALSKTWSGNVFCNPPYGRKIRHFIEKAVEEAMTNNLLVVLLIPARVDTSYWHDFVFPFATDIRFLRGRLKFELNNVPQGAAPFPSAIVIYDYREEARIEEAEVQE